MTFEQLKDKGKETVKAVPELFVTFQKLYVAKFGSHFCVGCPDGFNSAWDLFEKKIKPVKVMNETNFVFKKNHLIYSQKSHSHYGQANITDEIAIRLLQESLGNIAHFEKFPDNWKELVYGVVSKKQNNVETENLVATNEVTKGKPKKISNKQTVKEPNFSQQKGFFKNQKKIV